MNKINTLLSVVCMFLVSLNAFSQDTVFYKAALQLPNNQSLPLTLQFIYANDTILSAMGSPAQSKELFKATKTRFTKDSVKINISNLGIKMRLKRINNEDTLQGIFKQGVLNTQITFEKQNELLFFNRPQTPKAPYLYNVKELTFGNPNCKYLFHGTLTYPKTDNGISEKTVLYPCVVLVSGSGCQNRDEEVFMHKPFAVIADYLTQRGIAVFRYDDRGFGSTDTNMYKGTTEDFASDAECAVKMLENEKMIDKNNIFVLGHSEGGMICQILGAKKNDIKGFIMMAAPFVSGKEILLSQTEAILKQNGLSEKEIEREMEQMKTTKYDVNTINGHWLDYFVRFEPKKYVEKIKKPVLVMQGLKDMQVIAEINMPYMEKYLSKKAEIKTYGGLNHLFQHCKTGNPDEYINIEETISVEALEDIKAFVFKTINK